MANRSDKANKTAATDSGPVTIFAKSRKNRARRSAAEPSVVRFGRTDDMPAGKGHLAQNCLHSIFSSGGLNKGFFHREVEHFSFPSKKTAASRIGN